MFDGVFMVEMMNNSFYESKISFGRLIERERYNNKKKVCKVKKMSFSGKYTKMLILKKFLISECIFKLVCFCESCRGSGVVNGMTYLHVFFKLQCMKKIQLQRRICNTFKHI